MLVPQGIIIKYLWGGGELKCTPKSTGVQLGQRGTGCSTRTLVSAGSNCSDTTQNPKMTRKEEAQFFFYFSPPTHTPAQPQCTKDGYLKNASYQMTSPPSPLTQNLPPPHKNISDPPTPYPIPLCVLYHNMDSSDQWWVQGDSGGSL